MLWYLVSSEMSRRKTCQRSCTDDTMALCGRRWSNPATRCVPVYALWMLTKDVVRCWAGVLVVRPFSSPGRREDGRMFRTVILISPGVEMRTAVDTNSTKIVVIQDAPCIRFPMRLYGQFRGWLDWPAGTWPL